MTAPAKDGRPRILVCFGTRPEAIKMVPVVQALRAQGTLDIRVAVTAQHREMLDQVLAITGLVPDIDLDLMKPGQSLDGLSAQLLTRFGKVLDDWRPDRVVVHGDTLTTMMVSISSYFRRIPVAHVEAGLRSGNIYSPWPEEANRRITAVVADLHFAPTETAAQALRQEGCNPATIHVTGNTVIDALQSTVRALDQKPELAAGLDYFAQRFAGKRIIALTAHRRENFGPAMENIAAAIAHLARRKDVAVIVPVHPNPQVQAVFARALTGVNNVALIGPLDYPHFVRLMIMADVLLTDSGGIQEEAPGLGKPVLVLRDTTERPEGVAAGTARLVGTDSDRIVVETERLLDNPSDYAAMAEAHNPYGDGRASERIAAAILEAHCRS